MTIGRMPLLSPGGRSGMTTSTRVRPFFERIVTIPDDVDTIADFKWLRDHQDKAGDDVGDRVLYGRVCGDVHRGELGVEPSDEGQACAAGSAEVVSLDDVVLDRDDPLSVGDDRC